MKMLLSIFFAFNLCVGALKAQDNDEANPISWEKSQLLFKDKGTKKWQEKWILDGQRAEVIHTKKGMELIAGSEIYNDTCHAVLWTKQSFEGNICIEYDYTRTDTTTRCVNILYFHATGKGDKEYPTDISLWNDKREIPKMSLYYDNMNAYHISYAAFSAREYSGDNDYIKLRRYNPALKTGLEGTQVKGEYHRTVLFKPGVTYHIQVFKYDNQIEMRVQNKEDESEGTIYRWDVSLFPACESGRIGLRHMYTRSARYKNFKVWKLK